MRLLLTCCGDIWWTSSPGDSLCWYITVRTVFGGLWKFGANGMIFSRPWKSVKTEWGLWKFVVFRVLGKNYQLISQKLHFPRPNSRFFFFKLNITAKSPRTHFLSVLTDRVCWPLAIVRVTPLYWMCGRVAYFSKVWEKFVNFKRIFCMNPVHWKGNLHLLHCSFMGRQIVYVRWGF